MILSRRSVLGSLMLATAGSRHRMTAPYVRRELGPRFSQGISDATQNINPFLPGTGWDVIFQPSDFDVPDPEFECYHISLDGPVGASGAVLINGKVWDYLNQMWKNGWDPSQPMLIRAGQSVQFCWNKAFAAGPYNQTTNIRPVVTMWLRHPPADILAS